MSDLMMFSIVTANGIAVLLITSIGLAIIFGVMRVINLAHGEFIMLGAFATVKLVHAGLPLPLAIIAAGLVVAAFGIICEQLLIRHLYGRLQDTMLATWGLSMIMVQGAVMAFGVTSRGISAPGGTLKFGEYSVSHYTFATIIAAPVMVGAVWCLLKYTKYGALARATMQLPEAAAGLGVNVRRVKMITFGVGSGAAGLAGGLMAPIVAVVPNMGQSFVVDSFLTVIVGGAAAVSGTVAAGLGLGLVQGVVQFFASSFLAQVAVLIAAIVIVRLAPEGISGKKGWRL